MRRETVGRLVRDAVHDDVGPVVLDTDAVKSDDLAVELSGQPSDDPGYMERLAAAAIDRLAD